MTSCAEIPGKIGTNDGLAVGPREEIALKNLAAGATMRQTNVLHALFHRPARLKGCSKALGRRAPRRSSPTSFNSRISRLWSMKTCSSRRPQAAAKHGLHAKKSV